MRDSPDIAEEEILAPPPYGARARPRRRSWLVYLLVVVALLGAAAWAFGDRLRPAGDAAPTARRAPPAPEVTLATVARREAVIRLQAVGTVQPIKSVQIMPQVEGPIMRVAFSDGQTVRPGEILFEIDPRPYQAALGQAQGQLQSDQANLLSARQDLARTTQLAQSGFAARQSLDQQRARVAQLEASIKTAQARIDQARIDLERTTMRAPIGGRLSAAQLTEGNIVRPGQQNALTTIMQIAPIDVQFTVPQDQLPAVQSRQAAGRVDVAVFSPDTRTELGQGELVFIDNRVDQATGTVSMKARFANREGRLWPGQFVNVALELDKRPDAVVVDARAVQMGPNGRYVYVVQDNRAEPRPVRLVELQEQQGIVAEGLHGGEQVIVDGHVKVVPGGQVRVRDAQPRRAAGPPPESPGAGGARQ